MNMNFIFHKALINGANEVEARYICKQLSDFGYDKDMKILHSKNIDFTHITNVCIRMFVKEEYVDTVLASK